MFFLAAMAILEYSVSLAGMVSADEENNSEFRRDIIEILKSYICLLMKCLKCEASLLAKTTSQR